MNNYRFIEFPSLPDIIKYSPAIINGLSTFFRYRKQIAQVIKFVVGLTVFALALRSLIVPFLISLFFYKLGMRHLEEYFMEKARSSAPGRILIEIIQQWQKSKERKKDQIYHAGIF